MLGKNTIKLIKSLALKKYRTKEGLFLVEGDKLVSELLNSQLQVQNLIVTEDFPIPKELTLRNVEKVSGTMYSEIKKASLLKSPQNSIAICRIPETRSLPEDLKDTFSLYLDGIQDPGNLGTIIRICDWFGITQLFCSPDTVDLYNPKVIQASMGSFNRVKIWETDFEEVAQIAKTSGIKTYGAFMHGENLYNESLPKSALLVMGNEGNGIRQKVENLLDQRLSIPNMSTQTEKAESLNVSVATAIICSEFKRKL